MPSQSGDIEIIKKIDAYLKDQLSEEESNELWVELLQNPEYLEYLETEITVKRILERKMSSNGGIQPAKVTEIGQSWKWFAAAASVALLVLAISFLQPDRPTSLKLEAIGSINMTNSLAAPMVMRSQKSELTGADSLMNIGFEAALSGNVDKAISIYQDVIARYENPPAAAQAHLNIGIIQYNNGQYESSAESFQQALSEVREDEILEEKAYWYLGNAYINLDHLEKAREAVHSAYSIDGTYRKPAFRLLRKLDYKLGNIDFDDFEQQMEDN